MAADGTLTTETGRMKRVQAEWVDVGRDGRTCVSRKSNFQARSGTTEKKTQFPSLFS